MAESADQDEPKPTSGASQRPPVFLAVVAAVSLGAAGYLAVGSNLVPGLRTSPDQVVTDAKPDPAVPATAFVALEPFMVTLAHTDPARQLRLEVQLEVAQSAQAAVVAATPRLQDTLNTYLRAIDLSDVEDPDTMLRMRMQLLRRMQVAVGDGLIRDLLVTQFLIS